ncbi:MAG: septum formation protein Maf [Barnesiella sp.]|nr:septum formation protein Maf [Barnesiella sp.]
MKKILLGSGSPRRRELLSMMDVDYEAVKLHDVEEVYPDTLAAEDVPAYLSRLKAQSYVNQLKDNELLITADTVVIIDGDILGKPKDAEDAVRMLCRLSGAKHKVITGVSLTSNDGIHTFDEVTEVEFNEVPEAEIRSYVAKYQPFDKAGSYGIQEWIGLVAIKKIDGCFYNVMGLPTATLYREMKKIGAF